jgi:hypothetical protein
VNADVSAVRHLRTTQAGHESCVPSPRCMTTLRVALYFVLLTMVALRERVTRVRQR